jgi:hypothetical protein
MATNHINASPLRAGRPLRNVFLVVYATLGLLACTASQAVVNRLSEAEPNLARDRVLKASVALHSFASSIGITLLFDFPRRRFLNLMRQTTHYRGDNTEN